MKKIKKELTDLLGKIKEETFYGEEEKIIHPTAEIIFEYSPGRFCIKNKNPDLPNDSFMEMTFSNKYKINTYKEKNPFTGQVKEYNKEEIKGISKHGFINNFLRRDPRYILKNSKDHKKTSEGLYTMIVWDKAAKGLIRLSKDTKGEMVDIMQTVEIQLENNKLKRMIVKNNFLKKSGTVEKKFTDIIFKYE